MTVSIEVTNNSVLNLLRELDGLKLLHLRTPVGSAETPDTEDWNGCPLCARYHEPNEETLAALTEGDTILRGEIPAKRFDSLEEMLVDLDMLPSPPTSR
jgi:hypothetical protein